MSGAVPPHASSVWEYAVPTTPARSAVVRTAIGATVGCNLRVAVSAGEAALVTMSCPEGA